MVALLASANMSALTVEQLRTQHLNNPVGIDEASPTFSWILASEERGVTQQSYRITVATDKNMSNVVWDSGNIESEESTNVRAEGFTTQASTRYYWTVEVKDNNGNVATSSTPSYFETGLRDTGWSGASWLKVAENNKSGGSGSSFDPSTVKNYTVEADFEIERVAAGIIWGATDHNNYYMWQFNIEKSPTKFRPHRWNGGNAACLAEIDVELVANKSYHMRVDVSENGTKARTYLDDVLIDERTGSFPYGDMGMRSAMAEREARYYETSYYDDFKVTANGRTVFEDHFYDRCQFDNGRIVGGKLRVEGDCYAWQTNFQPDASITDYTFEGKFTIDQVAAGICFAGIDSDHYYMWQFNVEKSEPMFRPHRWNGGAACLAEIPLTNTVGLTQGKEYNVRIEISGGGTMARTYLNNVLIDEREGEYTYGKIGIRAAQGENDTRTYERAYYDNFIARNSDTGEVLFSENFDNPGAIAMSDGDPIDGRLRVGAYSDLYVWAIDNSSIDPNLHYIVEADMTLIKDNAAIIFGYNGSVNFNMWAINTVNHANPCVRRHVYAGSSTPVWSDNEFTNFTKTSLIGTERHLKIEVQGNLVTTSIDGQIVDTFKETSGALSTGYVGFRANSGDNEDERSYWDNIKVTVFDENGNASVTIYENFEGAANEFDDAEIIDISGNHKLNMYSRSGETRIIENHASGTPMFRKKFSVAGKVRSAKLYTSALGNYNVFINGKRVGHLQDNGEMIYDELMPGWTEYRKKVFYCTHDVTSLVTEGDNAIGAQLSNGWWGGDIAHGVYGSPNLAFIGKLVITLSDGTEQVVVTDESWTTSTNGPIKRGDIYHGETYDARDADGWATAGYAATGWNAAAIDNQFTGSIVAFEGPAVRVRKHLELKPKSITVYDGTKATGTAYGEINVVSTSTNKAFDLKKGQTAIFDLGQNFAGWVKFNVKGAAGTVMKMRFAEMLNDKGDTNRGDDGPGGSLYTINLRNAKCLLKYTLSGAAEGETYNPSTTFYGFRYCEITASEDISVNSLVGEVVGSEIEEGASLVVDNTSINQLYSNVLWGQRSNFLSIPTDCPQRDERLGWTADTQIFSNTAAYNSDVVAFYRKWMGDMRDSQREDGAYPDVAPYCWVGFGQAAWGDAGVIVPWNVYSMTGNTDIIKENYESMEKYMAFVANQAGDGYKYNGAGTSYGDWVSFEDTERRYVSVTYYAYMADLMARMASVLSESDGDIYAQKAQSYSELFNNIKAEFGTRYLNNGLPTIDSQCAMLLALRFNLLPDENAIARTTARLREKIVANGNKLSTGFLGTAIINLTLSDFGMTDLAYTLLLQRECPSWLYSVDQGATTIWERWDSYTIDRGFHKDVTMNSFNHYAYGAVAEWMYRHMAGMAPAKPGFKHINFRPEIDDRTNLNGQPRICDVDASFTSPYGKVRSKWQHAENGNIVLQVEVPANTTATVYYPLSDGQTDVYEGDVIAKNADGVEYVTTENGKAVFNVKSGIYLFSDGQSGVDDVTTVSPEIAVYPNPAHDVVTVSANTGISAVNIFDISGNLVKTSVGESAIDVSSLIPGMYIVKAEGTRATVKLIKQ